MRKNATINMNNEDDNECFKCCITRALNMVEKNAERITNNLRMQTIRIRFDDMVFPTKLTEIKRFEKMNEGIAVNVFGLDETKVYPLRISDENPRFFIIDLLIEKRW